MIGTSLLFSGSIAGLLGPGDIATPTAGYSLRPLSVSYSGAVVRVRRSGDNEEKDFNASGITDGQLSDFLNVFTESGHILNVYEHFKREFTESPLTFYNFEDVSLVSNCIEESSGLIAYDALANMVSHQVAVYTDLDWATINDPSLVSPCNDGQADELNAFDDLLNLTTQNDGYVVTWYDQFGSNDATNSTAADQPKIWDASTGLVTENGKPALDFDGSNDVLKIPDFAYNVAGGKLTIFATSLCEASTGSNQYLFAHYEAGTNNRSWAVIYNDSGRFEGSYSRNGSSADLQTMEFNGFSFNTQYLTYYIFDTSLSAGNRIKGSYNGVDFTLNNRGGSESSIYNSAGDLSIGSALTNGSSSVEFRGLVQEIIFYDSDQSANRTKIEDNINDYYDIY